MGFGRYTRFGINALQVVLSARVFSPQKLPTWNGLEPAMTWLSSIALSSIALAIEQGSTSMDVNDLLGFRLTWDEHWTTILPSTNLSQGQSFRRSWTECSLAHELLDAASRQIVERGPSLSGL